jgi:hypothetical protein
VSRKKIVALALAGAMASVGIAAPAQAEPWVTSYPIYVYTDGELRGACAVQLNNGWWDYGVVEDANPDGIGVYGRFKLNNGKIYDISDPDGSGPKRGIGDWRPTAFFVTQFECVSRDGGSTGWRTPPKL